MADKPGLSGSRARVLYVVSEDWYFHSHRLALAKAAMAQGFDVAVATGVGKYGEAITAAGVRLHPLPMRRRSMHPLKELITLRALRRIIALERPAIVHNVALKPVLYGSIAARLVSGTKVINAIAGMGHLFTSSAPSARLLKRVVQLGLRAVLNNRLSRVIVQNPEDRDFLVRSGLARAERITLIRGSGVDPRVFRALPEPRGTTPLVVLASRMLYDKGVPQFAAAARLLRDKGVSARFALVGGPDPDNPASVPEHELRALKKECGVEWWGPRTDMPAVLASANIVCLPSTYGEGLPKVLLEAAASGRAIVATDIPGCREIVQHGVNGLLVPTLQPQALAEALETLLENPVLREHMGAQGRALVESQFTIDRVTGATIELYHELLREQAQ